MTAFQLDADEPSGMIPGIKHRCLRRKSLRTYELLDPKRLGDVVSFDVGQIKAIVEMDGRIRKGRATTSVPAGYSDFAARFNEYTTGPERFATLSYAHGKPETYTAGIPIVWEHFLIDDSLVVWNLDSSSREPAALSSQLPGVSHHGMQTLASQSVDVGKLELPHLRALSTHMKGALETTDQLAQFWIKRGAIEHDYASRLAKLAEKTIGEREPSEFRDAIDGFRVEAARQAMNHNTLAMQIAIELEARCLNLQIDQAAHWRDVYEPGVKKLEETSVQERKPRAGISAEWKRQYRNVRHSLDLTRLQAMKNSIHSPFRLVPLSSAEPIDLNTKREGYPIRESPARGSEWETLLSSCRKMEANRSYFMKALLSSFTDILASVRGSQDESHGTIIRTFDLFRPQEVLEEFHKNFAVDGESQSFRKISNDNGVKNPGQECSMTPSNMLSPRPLPRPPGSAAPLFYLKMNGKEKEKESLESGDVVAVSALSSGNSWSGQVLSGHAKNPRKGAIPRTQDDDDTVLVGPRSRANMVARPNPLPLPSISRSISLTSRSVRHRPLPSGADEHHQHHHTPLTTNLPPLAQTPPVSQRGFRPLLPKLNTRFDS